MFREVCQLADDLGDTGIFKVRTILLYYGMIMTLFILHFYHKIKGDVDEWEKRLDEWEKNN